MVGNQTLDLTNPVSKFDFAALAEIGAAYKFKSKYWLFTSVAYQYSFTTITNSEYFANSKIRHEGLILSILLKLDLTKK